ncbi:MAG: cadmium-translocating P-type ATPase [Betaproteobacteria bacterium]|nr:cadmium-translocating P-type ATPase [Betaproteobacteria bacterium]
MSTVTEPPFAAAPRATHCFHCGEPVPDDSPYHVVVDGVARQTCCAGCAAVARTIIDNGLAAYYRYRSELPRRELAVPVVPEELRLYDLPEVQRTFAHAPDAARHRAALLVEGITCGACVWLIEQRLRRMPGVFHVAVNMAARRAQVEWDPECVQLSAILLAIADLGYRAQPFDPARSESAAARERRTMLWRLFVAGFGMMQVMMYAVPVYLAQGGMSREFEAMMRWASLVLTLPVVAWSAGPFFTSAWRDLRARRVGMDVPVALGIAAAFIASAYATVRGAGEVYFDSISMFVFLLLGARFLEASARSKAADAQQRLVKHMPAVAERLTAEDGATERVAVASLKAGDRVQVAPGAVVPTDGCVLQGASATDEALLTGESRPVAKRAGDAVIGGSINLRSPLTVEVTRVGQDTLLAGIVRLMDRAQGDKPRIAQLADRVAQWFVAALLAVAAVTALAWYALDPQRALSVVVAVLVVTCPCALSLATPAALTAATGALYRLGMLITRGHALETLARATHVVFDKTGTLTTGRLSLIGVMPLDGRGPDDCLRLAASLEGGSEHPVARAIAAAAPRSGGLAVADPRNVPGEGVEARVEGLRVRIGSPAFVAALTRRPLPAEMLYAVDEITVVALGSETGWIALFTFGDALRSHARTAVRGLQTHGLAVCMLSGDRRETAGHVARELGIEAFHGEATPQDKLDYVRRLQAQGAIVAVVGDGVNDAPVLAQAQVSVAMGGGTDLAHASADMVLLGGDLDRLLEAVDVARNTMRVIRQNLAWAVAYNAVALPLAVAGLVTPLAAGIGMALSSLAVVLNALRLTGRRGAAPDPDRRSNHNRNRQELHDFLRS